MSVWILDDSLKVDVFYECEDKSFDDNICLVFDESCPWEEKVFRADQTHMFLTVEQARQITDMLLKAIEDSRCLDTSN